MQTLSLLLHCLANDAKLSDIQDVQDISQNPELYVFECENSSEDPVSVIIRGHLPVRAKNFIIG